MMWISFCRWNHGVGRWFVMERIRLKGYAWTPLVRVRRRNPESLSLRRWLLEDHESLGIDNPPNSNRVSPKFRIGWQKPGAYIEWWAAGFTHDGHDIDVVAKHFESEHSEWKLHIAADAFRCLARWYLWRWAWGEWFGLRRKLYYWDLSRRRESERPEASKERK